MAGIDGSNGSASIDARLSRMLFALEAAWYAAVWWAAVVLHVGTPRAAGRSTEYWVMGVLALGAAAAALLRWRRPRATDAIAATVIGLGVLVVAILPPGSLGPLRLTLSAAVTPILLAACVRRARPGRAAAVALLAAGANALDVVVGGNSAATDLASRSVGSQPSIPLSSVTATLLVLAPVVLGLLLRSRDTIRQVAVRDRLRTEERLKVARELHDTIANNVTSIILSAQVATLGGEVPEPTRRALGSIETAGQQALAAMARMVGALRSAHAQAAAAVDAELPAETTSPLAAVRLAIDADPTVTLHLTAPAERDPDDPGGDAALEDEAPADVIATVHRVVAEALTNARRYRAPGTPIHVAVAMSTPSSLTVDVSNRRSRTAATSGSGYGLIGLRERAAAVGGRVHAGPDGAWWRFHAEIPWAPEPGHQGNGLPS